MIIRYTHDSISSVYKLRGIGTALDKFAYIMLLTSIVSRAFYVYLIEICISRIHVQFDNAIACRIDRSHLVDERMYNTHTCRSPPRLTEESRLRFARRC